MMSCCVFLIDIYVSSVLRLSESFDLMKELGSGGFGEVYKVKHKFDGKIYAVKRVVLTE